MKQQQKIKTEYKFIEQRPQPNDPDTEETLLSTLFRRNELYAEYADILTPELFYDERRQAMFKCIEGLISEGKATDLNSLAAYAKSHNVGFQVTRQDFYEIIQKLSPTTIKEDIARLQDLSKRRSVWKQLLIAADKVFDYGEETDAVVNDIISTLGQIQQQTEETGVYTFKEAVDSLRETVKNNRDGVSVNYIKTGFNLLDKYFVISPTTMTVIAAFTSVGKTALAMNIAERSAADGNPVAYYSMEMGKEQLAARVLSGGAGLSASDMLYKKLSDTELEGFNSTAQDKELLPIHIDERTAASFDRIIRSIRSLVQKRGIKLAIIDYLQILNQTGESKEQALAYMARQAKNIATELNIAVILLSQLNRSSDHPSINMLRGSGEIEESADNIILIDRPEAYPNNKVKSYEGSLKGKDTHNTAALILTKGRNVGVSEELIGFEPRYTKFYELNENDEKEDNAPF